MASILPTLRWGCHLATRGHAEVRWRETALVRVTELDNETPEKSKIITTFSMPRLGGKRLYSTRECPIDHRFGEWGEANPVEADGGDGGSLDRLS
jgi:hypothetical protein